ncbi:MAG: hypothetical protein O7F09_06335 [Chloroflexi bacterium]|nr:hypothetical protein [Chloroflexota bacterium]MCZ6788349.1 hypothetical protein [Chloroflexota bacterium]MCZ6892115.1 hypothetical protein [Chloroflexota bacterium]
MRGDKLIINEEHVRAARSILGHLLPVILDFPERFVLTIAGESGSGKSELSFALQPCLEEEYVRSVIVQQDDYFVYPPKTNAARRRVDINQVGVSEVRLGLLDDNLEVGRHGHHHITKPLVIFDEDLVTEEELLLDGVKVIIVDGTYTSLLQNVDRHIFIDRTYVDTKETRKRRARELQDEHLERVLEIEHRIIAQHRALADLIVTREYEVEEHERGGNGT